jgi:hypothetical protein
MKFVNYEDFGAIGDGRANDFQAIKSAHEYANNNKLSVKTKSDAVYYIGDTDSGITVMTDVDWNTSKFIIDDTNVSNRRLPIFAVMSDLQSDDNSVNTVEIPLKILSKTTEKLDITLPYKCQVILKNADVKHYIRYGLNQNDGIPQTDTIVIDKDGTLSVPASWDFDNITSMKVIPVDEKTLFITGGTFTTIANYEESKYNYFSRNISIRRSNVTIDGITHYIENERDHGAPYGGFISAHESCDITVKNCFFTGHKIYDTIGAAGKPVSMGSYDVNFGTCVNVNLLNCRQVNIRDTRYWGSFTSNHCKNIVIDGCYISRIDAHMGVTNYTIKNTTLGWQGLNAIGHGLLTVENVTSYSNGSLINLRLDYGSTWDGDVIIKNSTWNVSDRITNPAIIGGYNSGDHNFGYVCHLPNSVTIENLTVENVKGNLYLYNDITPADYAEKPYPYVMTVRKNIRWHNVTPDINDISYSLKFE